MNAFYGVRVVTGAIDAGPCALVAVVAFRHWDPAAGWGAGLGGLYEARGRPDTAGSARRIAAGILERSADQTEAYRHALGGEGR